MKHLFILITISLSSLGIRAQNNQTSIASNTLNFSYGQAYNLKLDRTYSRLAKNGFNHLASLGLESVSSSRIAGIQGSFMIGNLETKGNKTNIINDYAGNLRLKYLKRINKVSLTDLSLSVGANVDFRGDIWFPQNSELRYGWDINLGTGFSTSLRYRVNSKLSLQYDFDVSLIGILWRSHNNGQQLVTEEIQLENGIIASAFESPRFSHVFNTIYIDNSIKMFYAVYGRLNIYYNFAVLYKHITVPLAKKGYEFHNAIGISYNFYGK